MLHGVLNMPIDVWVDSQLDKQQRRSRYVEASQKIKALEDELDRTLATVKHLHVMNGFKLKNAFHDGAYREAVARDGRGKRSPGLWEKSVTKASIDNV